jgi:hypothetical protein
MSGEKIQYTVQSDQEAFLEEFAVHWTDEQFDRVTAGLRGRATIDVSTLPDPDTVDPKKDPVTARNILLNPKSTFKIGEQPFVLPLLPYLTAAQQQVQPEIQVLKEQYNLYMIKYGIDAKPQDKERFSKVELRLDYPDRQGFITFSMIPDTELEERFSAQAKIKVGLDPYLKFKVPDIPLEPGSAVGGGVELATTAGFLLHWDYKPLAAKVIALGKKSLYAEWTIEKPKQMAGSVELATILCVPKNVSELPITVEGYYCLERGIWWWQRETTVKIKSSEPIVVQLP